MRITLLILLISYNLFCQDLTGKWELHLSCLNKLETKLMTLKECQKWAWQKWRAITLLDRECCFAWLLVGQDISESRAVFPHPALPKMITPFFLDSRLTLCWWELAIYKSFWTTHSLQYRGLPRKGLSITNPWKIRRPIVFSQRFHQKMHDSNSG